MQTLPKFQFSDKGSFFERPYDIDAIFKVETMSEDSKAMFQSKNFTLPDGWVLNEPQRSFNGGFGTAGIKKIIDHTRKMFQNVPGMILIL